MSGSGLFSSWLLTTSFIWSVNSFVWGLLFLITTPILADFMFFMVVVLFTGVLFRRRITSMFSGLSPIICIDISPLFLKYMVIVFSSSIIEAGFILTGILSRYIVWFSFISSAISSGENMYGFPGTCIVLSKIGMRASVAAVSASF